MLVLDKSLPCIEVDTQDIIALYRSTAPVSLSSESFGAGHWLAYLCGVQEQNAYAVFLALMNPNSKKIHVYTLDEHPENRDEYAKTLQDAVRFAEEMGFSMESVNIDYSRALREVIISDTKVIKAAKHGKRSIVRKNNVSSEKSDEAGKSDFKASSSQNLHLVKNSKNVAVVEQNEDSIASAGGKPVAAAGTGKNSAKASLADSVSVQSSPSETELKQLHVEKAEKEKDFAKQSALARSEVDRLKAELAEMDKKAAGELLKLKKESERLAEEKADVEKTASDELAAVKAGIESLTGELSQFRKNAGEELAALRAEAEKLSEEKDAADRAAAEELAAARAETEKLVAEIEEAGNKAKEKIARQRADAERLNAEKLTIERNIEGDLAAAETDVEVLAAELSSAEKIAFEKLLAVRAEAEKLRAEKADAEAKSAKTLAEAREEADRLSAELREIEASTGQDLASLLEETERLSAEKEAAEKEGVEKVESARAAVAALVAEKTSIEATLAEQLSAVRKEEETIAAEKKSAEKDAGKQLAEAQGRVDRLSAEIVGLEAAAAQELASLLDEEDRLKAEKIAAEKEAAGKVEAVKDELEKLAAEKAAGEEMFAEQLAMILAEAEKLSAEKETAENAFAGELAAARTGLERVISETIYSVNSIVGKLVEMKSRAEGYISGFEVERPVFSFPDTSDEKTVVEEKPLKKTYAGETGEKKAAAEKNVHSPETGRDVTVTEKQAKDGTFKEKEEEIRFSSMKFGEETLSVEKALAELAGEDFTASVRESVNDTSEKAAESSEILSSPIGNKVAISETVEERGTTLRATEDIPEEGSESEADGEENDFAAGFHIEKSLNKINYDSKEDIVEAYQSLNSARVTPEGYVAQNSRAYICAVKKSGSVSVFIGLQLTDTDKVLVYVPGKQPKARNFRKTVQDAIDFLETAGFLMDHMSLGNDSKTRAKIIGKIPVLGGTH
jgi:hypothetical protein